MLPLHPVVVALLRPHKAAQAAERLRAGDQWAGTNNLVFMTELGRPADPRNLLRVVAAAAKDGQRRGCRCPYPAALRAVGWLEAGVHIKAVADLLGHSSISITSDVYGHTSDDTARGAVDG